MRCPCCGAIDPSALTSYAQKMCREHVELPPNIVEKIPMSAVDIGTVICWGEVWFLNSDNKWRKERG